MTTSNSHDDLRRWWDAVAGDAVRTILCLKDPNDSGAWLWFYGAMTDYFANHPDKSATIWDCTVGEAVDAMLRWKLDRHNND